MNNVQILMMNQQDSVSTERPLYGYLYNWYAASHTNFAPNGWRLPNNTDWGQLINYLGGESVAGSKMKETGTTHWIAPNEGATNQSGFTALPGGDRYGYSGEFYSLTRFGYWWSSTRYGSFMSYYYYIGYDDYDIDTFRHDNNAGYSVRLIKDSTTLSHGESSIMIDIEGNVYDTICIGTQEWTVQNWKCTKLNGGTSLTKVTDNTTWSNAGVGYLYYCAHDNNESNV